MTRRTLEQPTTRCPLFEVPIGREVCQAQSRKLATNEATCCGRGCPSPWRICVYCLRQGQSGPESLVVDPVHGTCKTHAGAALAGSGENVIAVPASRVRPLIGQPRKYFDPLEMLALEKSVLKYGQLQPGLVRKLPDDLKHDYELVDGQRRWHTAQRLGTPFRAVVIRIADDEDQFEKSVASNFQRADHTPMEIARAIDRLVRKGGRSHQDVATLLGRTVTYVTQYHRLLSLAPELKKLVEPGTQERERIPITLAVQLALLPVDEQRSEWARIKSTGAKSSTAILEIKERMHSDGRIQHRQEEPRTEYRRLVAFPERTLRDAKQIDSRLTQMEMNRIMNHRAVAEIQALLVALNGCVDSILAIEGRVLAALRSKDKSA